MIKDISLLYVCTSCLGALFTCYLISRIITQLQNRILTNELNKLIKSKKKKHLNRDILKALKEEEDYEERYGKSLYD